MHPQCPRRPLLTGAPQTEPPASTHCDGCRCLPPWQQQHPPGCQRPPGWEPRAAAPFFLPLVCFRVFLHLRKPLFGDKGLHHQRPSAVLPSAMGELIRGWSQKERERGSAAGCKWENAEKTLGICPLWGALFMWPKLVANPIPEQQQEWGRGANGAGSLTSCMLLARSPRNSNGASCVPPHAASPKVPPRAVHESQDHRVA